MDKYPDKELNNITYLWTALFCTCVLCEYEWWELIADSDILVWCPVCGQMNQISLMESDNDATPD